MYQRMVNIKRKITITNREMPVLILLKKFHFVSKFLRSSLNVCESVISMSMFWICLLSGKCIDIVMP